MRLVSALPGWLHRIAAHVLLPAIVLLSVLEVFCRYVLGSPLGWTEEVIGAALLMAFMGSIPWGIEAGAHVRVETLYEAASPRWRRRADRIGDACGAVFFALLGLGFGTEAVGMFERGDATEIGGLPQWPIAAFVCIVAGGVTLWFGGRCIGPTRR